MPSLRRISSVLLIIAALIINTFVCAISDHRYGNVPAPVAPYTVIICAIALGEDDYIEEWIQYHLLLGFDAIQLFDNSPNHTLRSLPDQFSGAVGVVHFPGILQQMPAYNLCVKEYREQPVWAAFIDIDEFIVLRQHRSVRDLINEYGYRYVPFHQRLSPQAVEGLELQKESPLSLLTDVSALALNWIPFGSSNLVDEPPVGGDFSVLRRFTLKSNRVSEVIKSIAYLPNAQFFVHPHLPLPRNEFKLQVDASSGSGRLFFGVVNWACSDKVAAINHYQLKSRAEFERKRLRGRSDRPAISEDGEDQRRQMVRSADFFYENDENIVQDTRAWDDYQQRLTDGRSENHFDAFYRLLNYPLPALNQNSPCSLVINVSVITATDEAGQHRQRHVLQWCSEDDFGFRLMAHCIDRQLLHERCDLVRQLFIDAAMALPQEQQQQHGITELRLSQIEGTMRNLMWYYDAYDLTERQISVMAQLDSPLQQQLQLGGEKCHRMWHYIGENDEDVLRGMKLFVVSHDDDSEALVLSFRRSSAFIWNNISSSDSDNSSLIYSVRVRSTVFFEYILYRDVLPFHVKQWQQLDYVGITSYKTLNNFSSFCSSEFQRLLKVGRNYNYDVLPLIRSKRSLLISATFSHSRNFVSAWDALLEALGYTSSSIRQWDHLKVFYRNSLLLRPIWLRRLCRFMSQAMDVVLMNSTVSALFRVSAGYEDVGDAEVSKRIFANYRMSEGRKDPQEQQTTAASYLMHPFVFERLISFFLVSEGARICHGNDLCPYNTPW